jgi:hypothetical protein
MFLGHVPDGLRIFEVGIENGHINTIDVTFAPTLVRGNRLGALGILAGVYPGQVELNHLLYRALTDPAFGERDRQEALGLISAGATRWEDAQFALWLLKAYDQIPAVPLVEAPTIWWARDDPGWLKSPARKALMKQWRLPEYWRKHGFPPQCQPIGASDFECR